MSYFHCPADGVQYPIFGEGGGGREEARLGVPLLAQIPLNSRPAKAEKGRPVALERDSAAGAVFHDLAQRLLAVMAAD